MDLLALPNLSASEYPLTTRLAESLLSPIGIDRFDGSERRQLARNLTWRDCVQGLATGWPLSGNACLFAGGARSVSDPSVRPHNGGP
jgi:hypothetical protein